jgi:hypothetical protein
MPKSSSFPPSNNVLAIELSAGIAIKYSQNALQKIKNPGNVSNAKIKNTSGILSKTGLLVVNSETCNVKTKEAEKINVIPTICPKIGKDIYLKNFSKFKKYNLTPLKNILATSANIPFLLFLAIFVL